MDFFISMLPMLLIGTATVMAGFLFNKKSEICLYTFKESIAWSIGFFVCFSAETLVLSIY
jgi:hypothetical protein